MVADSKDAVVNLLRKQQIIVTTVKELMLHPVPAALEMDDLAPVPEATSECVGVPLARGLCATPSMQRRSHGGPDRRATAFRP